uniref:Carbamoyl phosphate synthase arginine-specific large chain, chloroplastic n=2 Tax=Tetraselmis chuii TaxID=63592 RepID=A0A7S1SPT9_9CHLO
MEEIGIFQAQSGTATTMEQAFEIALTIGEFPLIIRPAFTLGGTGGGVAYNVDEFKQIVNSGIDASMTNQVLVEKSLLGWKEYELEVMRDQGDNVVIICSIENLDPMGVHTGDSITIAPAQTLTDREYQRLRDHSVDVIRKVGVECGGSNVQFSINPETGEVIIIEMNPRVSRSSALASKATGFPIAKIAAKLACGNTLDQIPNDITRKTPASFEPSIDYIVTKIPRFAFEKFPGASNGLSTMMKSVGEAMAMGRTFQESFQKALRSLETGLDGWALPSNYKPLPEQKLLFNLRTPNPERMVYIKQAFNDGMTAEEINDLTKIDPWFLGQFADLHETDMWLQTMKMADLTKFDWEQLKRKGYSDRQIAQYLGEDPADVRSARKAVGVVPSYKRVDTCAAEFAAETPYMYSCYDGFCEAAPTNNKKVLILGGGPNRIGQGIEFDYCCCHASFALRDAGYETIMMNSNPETVSTDYDTSSRLYFEPLTLEDVLNVVENERPDGIIVQFGGQTPLKLAKGLQDYITANPIPCASGDGNVRIWGTQPESIDAAEDREQWIQVLTKLNIDQPPGGTAVSEEQALVQAQKLGYPVMVRPSYVLGGRAMRIVYSDEELKEYIETAVEVDPSQPVLVDKYLKGAVEMDVDCLTDKDGNVVIAGIMEHIEEAGVHSGDSACMIPTQTISDAMLAKVREWTPAIAKELKVVGLMNIQYAVQNEKLYIIEANPRASRTVPFVAKAVGHPIAKYASLLMAGMTLEEVGFTEEPVLTTHVAVKEAVLPFDKFPGADTLLGPEMRSTGEVMGIDATFHGAYAKAAIAAGMRLPKAGNVFISVKDADKEAVVPIAKELIEMGFTVTSTMGTAKLLKEAGVACQEVLKIQEGRPNAYDMMVNKGIQMMYITSDGNEGDSKDGKDLRRLALALKVPCITTVAGFRATNGGIKSLQAGAMEQMALQDFFPDYK